MLRNVADLDLLNDQALTPQLLRASKSMYAFGSDITTSDFPHWERMLADSMLTFFVR